MLDDLFERRLVGQTQPLGDAADLNGPLELGVPEVVEHLLDLTSGERDEPRSTGREQMMLRLQAIGQKLEQPPLPKERVAEGGHAVHHLERDHRAGPTELTLQVSARWVAF